MSGARVIAKPRHVFDRDWEWRSLTSFVEDGRGGALGMISGRRRQGKTFLIDALARQTKGFYFGATQATEAESLRLFAQALAEHLRSPAPPNLAGWDDAMRYLFTTMTSMPGPVVIDEFPYLSKVSPELPSILQRELDRMVRQDPSSKLLLCGSAMSVMGGLLAGSAPLRGRAGLELIVRPFEYPMAARFWQVPSPQLAIMLHAVVGGTPAYRQFVGGDVPKDARDFDRWVLDTVLNPASPLFREARYLLEEQADVRDTALYHSVLAAVANGNNTRGGIANYIGRKATDVGHPLNVLEDAGLLRREPDVFRPGRSTYRIAEPLIHFYQSIMRPSWGPLESGRAPAIWPGVKARFLAQVLGPHFEQLCRDYVMIAPPDTFATAPGEVGSGVVVDPDGRRQIQIDVAVLGPAYPGERRKVLSLGEAKWGETMGSHHVERLRRARDLLAGKGFDTAGTLLTCYSGAGFERTLLENAEKRGVRAIGPERLYAVPAD